MIQSELQSSLLCFYFPHSISKIIIFLDKLKSKGLKKSFNTTVYNFYIRTDGVFVPNC